MKGGRGFSKKIGVNIGGVGPGHLVQEEGRVPWLHGAPRA